MHVCVREREREISCDTASPPLQSQLLLNTDSYHGLRLPPPTDFLPLRLSRIQPTDCLLWTGNRLSPTKINKPFPVDPRDPQIVCLLFVFFLSSLLPLLEVFSWTLPSTANHLSLFRLSASKKRPPCFFWYFRSSSLDLVLYKHLHSGGACKTLPLRRCPLWVRLQSDPVSSRGRGMYQVPQGSEMRFSCPEPLYQKQNPKLYLRKRRKLWMVHLGI